MANIQFYLQLATNGAWIENKQKSLTFHYRQVPDHLQDSYQKTATKLIESYGMVANQAHAAIEAKPPVRWNKGKFIDLITMSRDIIRH